MCLIVQKEQHTQRKEVRKRHEDKLGQTKNRYTEEIRNGRNELKFYKKKGWVKCMLASDRVLRREIIHRENFTTLTRDIEKGGGGVGQGRGGQGRGEVGRDRKR